MNGAQALVGAAGVGLVVANEWRGPDHHALAGVLWDRGADPMAAHNALVRIGAELLFVVVAVLLAGLPGKWPLTMIALFAALWVLWGINRHAPGARKGG